MVFLYITCHNEEQARKLGKMLLARRTAGSIHFFPAFAMNRGNGEVAEASETVMLVQTVDQKIQEIEDMVRKIHAAPKVCAVAMSRLNREHKEWLTTQIA